MYATWEKRLGQDKYWITVGFGDVVQTIIKKESDGLGYNIIKDGPMYDIVLKVNQELMKQV